MTSGSDMSTDGSENNAFKPNNFVLLHSPQYIILEDFCTTDKQKLLQLPFIIIHGFFQIAIVFLDPATYIYEL